MVAAATLVLAVTVSPAFASVCSCPDCASATMTCSMSMPSASGCAMPGQQSMGRGACGTQADRSGRDGTVADPSADRILGLTARVAFAAPPLRLLFCLAPIAPDARGAPHLTSVLRL
jgi:hypothetical protein